jgi:CMP-N-acetylneuraminic acid synthetase
MKKPLEPIHIAIIPARGGSKGVKHKNLRKIGSTSLVRRAWNSCLEAEFFQTIILSTDSEAICKEIFPRLDFSSISSNNLYYYKKQLVLHKRDSFQSSDVSSVYDTLNEIISNDELNFDYLWLIQPTNPFRSLYEFNEIRKLCEGTSEFTSVVSVKDVNGYHPDRMFKSQGENIVPYESNNLDISIARQLLPKLYIKDGGYYVFKDLILKQRLYLGNKILPYIRRNIDNINIDTIEDLEYARFVNLRKRKLVRLVSSLFSSFKNPEFLFKLRSIRK